MKTITAHEHDLILDVRNEGLTSLPPGIFEKDLLITEVLPTAVLPIASMLDVVIQVPSTDLYVECISVEETIAEKILSFLRRTAESRARRNRAKHDNRLVRHLYDVMAVAQGRGELALPHEEFAVLVAGDATQFRNQYPEFENDPVGQMRLALDALHHQADAFERDYLRFVDELVFGEPVTFSEARTVFIELAEQLLARLHRQTPAV